MIRIVIFDIDGVLTDGKVYVDHCGNEMKAFSLTEIDALNEIKGRGYKIAAITGEDTPIVDVFEKKVTWDWFFRGCKDKLGVVKSIEEESGIDRKDICYIGDGKYDLDPIEYVALGVCPENAISQVKEIADIVLKNSGGCGCINELLLYLTDGEGLIENDG